MAYPLNEKISTLAAKIEVTAGTAETLAGADGALNASNVTISDGTDYVPLASQGPSIDQRSGSHGPEQGSASFDIELASGSGSLPLWATAFLPSCGMLVSTSTYSFKSEPPGSNTKTVTIGKYENGRLRTIYGACGNAVFNFSAGRPASVSFSFTGIPADPTDTAMISPTYPTIKPLRFVSSSLLIGSFAPQVETLTLDLGNTVTLIPDSIPGTGFKYAVVVDRNPTITLPPLSKLVADFNPWSDFKNHTLRQISWTIASGGIGLTFTAPAAELMAPPSTGGQGGLFVDQLTYKLCRNSDSGDNSLTIALDISP